MATALSARSFRCLEIMVTGDNVRQSRSNAQSFDHIEHPPYYPEVVPRSRQAGTENGACHFLGSDDARKWRCFESPSNLSLRSNSLILGKIQGISADMKPPGYRVTRAIPLGNSREINIAQNFCGLGLLPKFSSEFIMYRSMAPRMHVERGVKP